MGRLEIDSEGNLVVRLDRTARTWLAEALDQWVEGEPPHGPLVQSEDPEADTQIAWAEALRQELLSED